MHPTLKPQALSFPNPTTSCCHPCTSPHRRRWSTLSPAPASRPGCMHMAASCPPLSEWALAAFRGRFGRVSGGANVVALINPQPLAQWQCRGRRNANTKQQRDRQRQLITQDNHKSTKENKQTSRATTRAHAQPHCQLHQLSLFLLNSRHIPGTHHPCCPQCCPAVLTHPHVLNVSDVLDALNVLIPF